MAKKFYTFIIVPNASSRLHKVRIPVRVMYVLAAIGFVSFFVAVGMGFTYARMAFRVADYTKLETENTELKIEKKNLEVTTKKLNAKLTDLESLSAKLTTLIENDAWTKRFGKAPAIGGSNVDYRTSDIVRMPDVSELEILKERAFELEGQIKVNLEMAERRADIIRFTPTIWPVQGRISSHFGRRMDPFTGDPESHLGLDISGLYGTRILAPADGRVIFAGRKSAYGNLVILDHGNGLTTRMGHMSRFAVHVGQTVYKGAVVGYVGNTGRTTAPHLHYEVRLKDRPVNPRNYLPKAD